MADLEVIYYDPKQPGSYSGVDKLYRGQTASTRKQVKQWLNGEDAYNSFHKPVCYHFPRNKVVVSAMDTQWDVDLMDMSRYRATNDGHGYILLAIDILSHYFGARPLKTKSAVEVRQAFNSVFAEGRKPNHIRSDRGKEFTNSLLARLFQANHVSYFSTNNEVKANYAERAIRTIKLRLSRYFSRHQTHRWVDILSDITSSYNHTYHRTIKRTPASVNVENQTDVRQIQYGMSPHKTDGPFKLQLGDMVHISHLRHTFQREYDERYTGEVFRVKSRRVRSGLNIYILEDLQQEELLGSFYELELQRVSIDPAGVFKVEKVLRPRKRRGQQ